MTLNPLAALANYVAATMADRIADQLDALTDRTPFRLDDEIVDGLARDIAARIRLNPPF